MKLPEASWLGKYCRDHLQATVSLPIFETLLRGLSLTQSFNGAPFLIPDTC